MSRTVDVGEQKRHRARRRANPHSARAYACAWVRPYCPGALDGEGVGGPSVGAAEHRPQGSVLGEGPGLESVVHERVLGSIPLSSMFGGQVQGTTLSAG